jgi:mRNA-degrading endonuclease toxin of MazEF toxin-antitoxin module
MHGDRQSSAGADHSGGFSHRTGEPTIVVLPLTTQVRAAKEPLHVTIPQRGELEQACQVMTEQPRTLDRRRLVKGPLTRLSADEMQRVERSFKAVVGMFEPAP